MIDTANALTSLTPNAQWILRGDELEWLDTEQTQPSQEDIVQKIAELEYIEEVEEYKRVRELAYPSSGEQFDKIFHDGVDAWKEMDDVMTDMVTVTAIDPVEATVEQTTYDAEGVATTSTVENPLITVDVAERATAQAVVDATPSAVVDTYNA